MCERRSMVEGFVSIFITIGRIYRLNNGSVMESGPPSRQEINVVAFLHAGNYRWCFFFQEAAGKKKSFGEFGESVWKMIHLYSGTPEGWKSE